MPTPSIMRNFTSKLIHTIGRPLWEATGMSGEEVAGGDGVILLTIDG